MSARAAFALRLAPFLLLSAVTMPPELPEKVLSVIDATAADKLLMPAPRLSKKLPRVIVREPQKDPPAKELEMPVLLPEKTLSTIVEPDMWVPKMPEPVLPSKVLSATARSKKLPKIR